MKTNQTGTSTDPATHQLRDLRAQEKATRLPGSDTTNLLPDAPDLGIPDTRRSLSKHTCNQKFLDQTLQIDFKQKGRLYRAMETT